MVTPTLYTRQGILGELNWNKQIGFGKYAVDAWGIYQLDPSAYAGGLGETGFVPEFRVEQIIVSTVGGMQAFRRQPSLTALFLPTIR